MEDLEKTTPEDNIEITTSGKDGNRQGNTLIIFQGEIEAGRENHVNMHKVE